MNAEDVEREREREGKGNERRGMTHESRHSFIAFPHTNKTYPPPLSTFFSSGNRMCSTGEVDDVEEREGEREREGGRHSIVL